MSDFSDYTPIPYRGGTDPGSIAMYGSCHDDPTPMVPMYTSAFPSNMEPRPLTPEQQAYLDSLTPLQRVLYPILAILSGGAFASALILIAQLF